MIIKLALVVIALLLAIAFLIPQFTHPSLLAVAVILLCVAELVKT